MLTRAIAVSVLVAGIALGIPTGFYAYINLEESSGTLLWDASEAYLFVGTNHTGYRVNFLRYPWFEIKSRMGAAEEPDNIRDTLTAIRVASSGVEQHAVKLEDRGIGSGPAMYTPLENHIYVNYPALGGLCRWTGDHFQPATAEERQRLGGIGHLTEKDIDRSANGWSKRSFSAGPNDASGTFSVKADNNFTLSVTNLADDGADRSLSIYLQHPGGSRERIWKVNLHWGAESKSDYERVFNKP